MQNSTAVKTSSHTFDPVILREYDIRGEVGKNLSARDAFALGQGFGTFLRRKNGTRMCVGFDGRTTSPELSNELIRGLNSAGIDVENIGLGPTPMLYFAVKDRKADAGIMVTGSHNPSHYNGFKMTLYKEPVFGEVIQHIGDIVANGEFQTGQGKTTTIDIRDAYVERLMKDYTGTRPLTIAWDNGNGAAGDILRRLIKKIPGQHAVIYDEIDGRFPNHHPDPTVDKNLIDLQKLVADKKADLGIAFDGDGDRIGIIDSNSNIIRCDLLMAIYAKEVLASHPGAAIVGDVKCSNIMFEEIARLGGRPVMWKTGHSLVKSKMAETKSPLGGELSGHIFFADKYYGFDDALYCAVRLINLVSAAPGGLESLTAHLPKLHNTPEVRFEVEEEAKFGIVPQITASIKSQKLSNVKISDIDGIRVETPDGWWLLRPSNTQNVLVARAEAFSPQGLERLTSMAIEETAKLGYELKFVQ